MAKRKTIGENPLDPVMPDPAARQIEEKARGENPGPRSPVTPAKVSRSSGAASSRVAAPKQASAPAKSAAKPAAHPPSSAELLDRIQSLEQRNFYLEWVVGAAILLAIII